MEILFINNKTKEILSHTHVSNLYAVENIDKIINKAFVTAMRYDVAIGDVLIVSKSIEDDFGYNERDHFLVEIHNESLALHWVKKLSCDFSTSTSSVKNLENAYLFGSSL